MFGTSAITPIVAIIFITGSAIINATSGLNVPFKNPPNNKAWELIKKSNCAGLKIGGAQISEKHCNFFVNNGSAKSSDLEKLINLVKSKVFNKTGINLELEVQIIGENIE